MLRKLLACLLLSSSPALAQGHDAHAGHAMPPDHAAMDHSAHQMGAMTGTLGGYPMNRDASGTAWQPDAAPHGGVHEQAGNWMLMGHLSLNGVYSNQSGPRGDDKAFAAGMAMGRRGAISRTAR